MLLHVKQEEFHIVLCKSNSEAIMSSDSAQASFVVFHFFPWIVILYIRYYNNRPLAFGS